MQFYKNLYRKLSNFQLAWIAGQSSSYLLCKIIGSSESNNRHFTKKSTDIDFNVENHIKIFNKNSWKDYYSLECSLIARGKFQEAYSIRQLSQKYAVYFYKQGLKISNKILLAWFLYQSCEKKSAIDIIDTILKNPLLLKLTRSKLRLLRDIFSNNLQNDYICENLSIYNLEVENEDVIVSGPLAEENYNMSQDEHVLIKINYIKPQNGTDTNVPDMSFYNGGAMKLIAKKQKELPYLHRYVFHRFVFDYQRSLIYARKARLTYSCDYVFGLGLPNMLPHVLFQLLASSAKSIKLLGFNLYMSKTIYNSSYFEISEKHRDIDSVKSSFVQHNIISQFQFIKALYDNKFFEADNLLSSIMDSGIECYLKKMECLVGM